MVQMMIMMVKMMIILMAMMMMMMVMVTIKIMTVEQGGIKCGNRGTGFLDSEGSHR